MSMQIWKKNVSIKDRGEAHKSIVLRQSEEDARMRALLDAAIEFPPGRRMDIRSRTPPSKNSALKKLETCLTSMEKVFWTRPRAD